MSYSPRQVPRGDDIEALRSYLSDELRQIEIAINNPVVDILQLSVLQELIDRPSNGMIVYYTTNASGISTEGIHAYENGTWNKL